MPTRITAAICTHNRAALLPDAIDSLLQQTLPAPDYEILVVDNASTDETPAVIRRYLSAPGEVSLRYIIQPAPGLSNARNLAVQHALGDIIAFMDDDAVAAPQWLAALLDAYVRFPDAWAAGGRILPIWAAERPRWLADHLLPQLSLLDLGGEARQLSPAQKLYGVNCSFHRHVFTTLGAFRPDLARIGSQLLSGEETELQTRIGLQLRPIIYAPDALVWHRIPEERLHRRFFIRLAYHKGRTRARLIPPDTGAAPLARHTGRTALTVLYHGLRLVISPWDPARQVDAVRTAANWLGFVQETALLRRPGRQ